MRGQLSLEFMLYIAVGVLALSGMLYVYMQSSAWMRSDMQASYMEEFVAAVNSNMGYSRSEFSIFVPAGLCDSASNATSITAGTALHFDAGVEISDNVCRIDGSVGNLTMTRLQNGTYEVDA